MKLTSGDAEAKANENPGDGARADAAAEKRRQVLQSSRAVFVSYGYGRTTMADLAKAAGISRPALYLIFASKEELFGAMIRQMNDESLAEIRAGIAELPTLSAQLELAFEIWVARGYDLVSAQPDARDLFDFSRAAVREIHAKFEALLTEILRESVALSGVPLRPGELAQSLRCALRGFKEEATDSADLRRFIAIQVALTVALLDAQ